MATDNESTTYAGGPRGRLRRGLALLTALGLAAAGAVACGASDGSEPSSTPTDSEAAASSLMVWAAANLPSSSVVYAPDPDVAALLAAEGLAGVQRGSPLGRANKAPEYVVLSAPRRATTIALTPTSSAQLVARFGTGSDALALGVAAARPLQEAEDRAAARAAQREQAGQRLLSNPQVSVGASMDSALRAGSLDLRAARLLQDLSAEGTVTLLRVIRDPAEQAQGTGARTIVVGGATPAEVADLTRRRTGGGQASIIAVSATDTLATTTVQWPVRAP